MQETNMAPVRAAASPPTVPNAVEVVHVTKRFNISYRGSLKNSLLYAVQPHRVEAIKEFTALQDITFCVPHGQTLAVIGRNGSGKSTLLSLLANVYKPTTGVVRLYSRTGRRPRIAPLLELGAGFHPDLTGLENMDFYAALLGMSVQEIAARRDDIIAFSELGDKVKTPLRGWNSGALLRLGFSIAIHTDPDILLVDEILAVGDEAFQRKCSERIQAMQAAGKTIVFVSHALPTVEKIAERVIWLHMGAMRMDGDTQEVLQAYREAAKQGL